MAFKARELGEEQLLPWVMVISTVFSVLWCYNPLISVLLFFLSFFFFLGGGGGGGEVGGGGVCCVLFQLF